MKKLIILLIVLVISGCASRARVSPVEFFTVFNKAVIDSTTPLVVYPQSNDHGFAIALVDSLVQQGYNAQLGFEDTQQNNTNSFKIRYIFTTATSGWIDTIVLKTVDVRLTSSKNALVATYSWRNHRNKPKNVRTISAEFISYLSQLK